MADTLKGFATDTGWGLVAPAAPPKDSAARPNQAFAVTLNAPEIKTLFATLLAESVPTTPEEFGALMTQERARSEGLVEASGARLD